MPMEKMRVLLAIDNAPDYRESFLRRLSRSVELVVLGQRCEDVGLHPPRLRYGYEYHDLPVRKYGPFMFQTDLLKFLTAKEWDVVCCDLNLRYASRIGFYRASKYRRQAFVWRGQIFGRNDNGVILNVKRTLLKGGDGCLVYSEPIASRVRDVFGIGAVSYNNTEVSEDEFRKGVFNKNAGLNVLFVGRFQERKRLERLLAAAQRNPWLSVRLVGPGMENLRRSISSDFAQRVEIFGRAVGGELNVHFDWADIVVNPGHVGLLVMNSARHGKGIVIDSSSTHAPEYFLAVQAEQPFIDFSNNSAVDEFLMGLSKERTRIERMGAALQEVAKREYTIEHMAKKHVEVFQSVTAQR